MRYRTRQSFPQLQFINLWITLQQPHQPIEAASFPLAASEAPQTVGLTPHLPDTTSLSLLAPAVVAMICVR
jgi:hypothetical protein